MSDKRGIRSFSLTERCCMVEMHTVQGISMRMVATKFDTWNAVVRKIILEEGGATKPRKVFTPEQRAVIAAEKVKAGEVAEKAKRDRDSAIRKAYDLGLSGEYLGQLWGKRYGAILNAVIRAGGAIRTGKEAASLSGTRKRLDGVTRKHTDEEEREWARLHLGPPVIRLPVLSERLGIPYHRIMRGIRRQGFEIVEVHRWVDVNEAIFDNAEMSPEAAYWVGLLITDGNVSDSLSNGSVRYSMSISLSGEDGEHLEQMRRFMESGHAISKYEAHGNVKEVSRLTIGSKRIAESLARYGVLPRKTHFAKVAILEDDPSFWCGAICGDGTICPTTTTGMPALRLVSASREFLLQFRAFCQKHVPSQANVSREKARGAYVYVLCGISAYKITRLLFENSPFALPKKLRLAQEMMRRFVRWESVEPRRHFNWVTMEHLEAAYVRCGCNWSAVGRELEIDQKHLWALRKKLGVITGRQEQTLTRLDRPSVRPATIPESLPVGADARADCPRE